MDLSSSLQSKEHINRTVKKANSDLGFLRRNLHINSCDTKSAAYITLVPPHLEYCASILSPHTVQSKQKLEMVQRRAARYCTNRYHNTSSVTEMLQDLNWKTLELRRTKLQLVMIYKIINDLVDIPSYPYLTQRQPELGHTIRSCDSIPQGQIPSSTASSQGPYLCRNHYQPQLLKPLTWYSSSRGCLLSHSKLGRGQSASRIGGSLELCRLGGHTQWQLL